MSDSDLTSISTLRKFSRAEYEQLIKLGVFGDERVELLRGLVVEMSPLGGPHVGVTGWLMTELIHRLPRAEFDVRAQSSYPALEDSMPEPDVSVVRRTSNLIRDYHREPLLIIEVSDSSLRKDRRIKAPIYAEAGVPNYWIVDVTGDELVFEVHTNPTPRGYRLVEMLRTGDVLRPVDLPFVLAIADIPWIAS